MCPVGGATACLHLHPYWPRPFLGWASLTRTALWLFCALQPWVGAPRFPHVRAARRVDTAGSPDGTLSLHWAALQVGSAVFL